MKQDNVKTESVEKHQQEKLLLLESTLREKLKLSIILKKPLKRG